MSFSLGVKTFEAERFLSKEQPSRSNNFTLIGCLSCSLVRYSRRKIVRKPLGLLSFAARR